MRNDQTHQDAKSLDSLSIDPIQAPIGASNIFQSRKSSFDLVNIFKDSVQHPRKDLRNSLDILASNIVTSRPSQVPIQDIVQIYNQENKVKIEQQGFQAMEIGEVFSQSQHDDAHRLSKIFEDYQPQQPHEYKIKLETVYHESKFNYHSYFPHDLALVLKERQIPLEYVKGLLMVRDQKEIKTTRKLKVERYLEKRRKKTWNRKICYNCRQKVAEERLRIKGKFIKKRRAMQILGLTIPIDTAILKQKLYAVLKDKGIAEIEQILKTTKKEKMKQQQEDDDSDDEDDYEFDDLESELKAEVEKVEKLEIA